MVRSRLLPAAVLAALGAVALTAAPAPAAIILYQTGFEAPTFTAGQPVEGQGGFVTNASPAASTVSTLFPAAGAQSLRIDADLVVDPDFAPQSFNWVPLGDPVAGGALVVRGEVDVAVFLSGPGEVQAGLQAYDQNGFFIAGININTDFQGTGPKLFYYTDTNNSIAFDAFGQYVRLGLTLDYTLGVASFDLNGTTLGTDVFAAGGGNVADFDLYMGRPVLADPSGTVAYFDNYLVTAAVPEPASVGLVAAGVAGLLGYARRRTATV